MVVVSKANVSKRKIPQCPPSRILRVDSVPFGAFFNSIAECTSNSIAECTSNSIAECTSNRE